MTATLQWLLCSSLLSSTCSLSFTKLVLDNTSVINGFGLPVGGGGLGDVYNVLDEQEAAGDPANGHPGSVVTQWVRGCNDTPFLVL
jgi:hypothetical protein